MKKDSLILTDNFNKYDKLEVHKKGVKHYAFSVFLFNKKNELLIQKRAKEKYHSGGLWSNTCCSHFRNKTEFKNKKKTIRNRLKEELGIIYNGNLKFLKIIEYNVNVNNGLIENEIDYVYIGFIDENLNNLEKNINKYEVDDVKFITLNNLKKDIKKNKDKYTIWLDIIINDIFK